MSQFALTIFREPLLGNIPGFILCFSSNDPHANSGLKTTSCWFCFALTGWPRVFHRRRAKFSRGVQAGIRRAGDKDFRKKFRRKSRSHSQLVDPIRLSVKSDWSGTGQKLIDDRRVFNQTGIALVVRSCVVQCDEVVFESAGEHVQVNPPVMKVPKGSHHLCNGIGVHVNGLNCYQGA